MSAFNVAVKQCSLLRPPGHVSSSVLLHKAKSLSIVVAKLIIVSSIAQFLLGFRSSFCAFYYFCHLPLPLNWQAIASCKLALSFVGGLGLELSARLFALASILCASPLRQSTLPVRSLSAFLPRCIALRCVCVCVAVASLRLLGRCARLGLALRLWQGSLGSLVSEEDRFFSSRPTAACCMSRVRASLS